jgi:arylsulfatase A-like enzyme
MVHALDESVGRILSRLEKLGVADNTLVVFTSDNGGVDYARVTTSRPLRGGKGRYWEGGVRVPLIVRGIAALPGAVTDTLAASTDLYPTILELAGVPPATGRRLDGRSLVQPLKGGHDVRKSVFWHYPHYHGSGARPVSAARVGDYKLLRHYEDGRRELYDLRKDPGETKDLIEAEPEIAVEVEAKLDAWLKDVGAYIPTRRGPGDGSEPRRPRRPGD